MWLWDAGYNHLGKEDLSDIPETQREQTIERTDLILNGERYELNNQGTSLSEFEWERTSDGNIRYTGGYATLFEGSIPFTATYHSTGLMYRRVTVSRPAGVHSTDNEGDFIQFNF